MNAPDVGGPGGPHLRATIVTARLRLVPLRADDVDALRAVLDDVALHRFTGGRPLDRQALAERLAYLGAGAPTGSGELWGNWVVRMADTGAVVGTVQVTLRDAEAAVAWVIGTAAQGRGLASEAAAALTGWLSGLGVERIVAFVHPDHHASAAVARRAGLRPTGRLKDGEVVWEWRPAD